MKYYLMSACRNSKPQVQVTALKWLQKGLNVKADFPAAWLAQTNQTNCLTLTSWLKWMYKMLTHLYRPSCSGQTRIHRSSRRCSPPARGRSGHSRSRSGFHILQLGDPQSCRSGLIRKGRCAGQKTEILKLSFVRCTQILAHRNPHTRTAHAQRF